MPTAPSLEKLLGISGGSNSNSKTNSQQNSNTKSQTSAASSQSGSSQTSFMDVLAKEYGGYANSQYDHNDSSWTTPVYKQVKQQKQSAYDNWLKQYETQRANLQSQYDEADKNYRNTNWGTTIDPRYNDLFKDREARKTDRTKYYSEREDYADQIAALDAQKDYYESMYGSTHRSTADIQADIDAVKKEYNVWNRGSKIERGSLSSELSQDKQLRAERDQKLADLEAELESSKKYENYVAQDKRNTDLITTANSWYDAGIKSGKTQKQLSDEAAADADTAYQKYQEAQRKAEEAKEGYWQNPESGYGPNSYQQYADEATKYYQEYQNALYKQSIINFDKWGEAKQAATDAGSSHKGKISAGEAMWNRDKIADRKAAAQAEFGSDALSLSNDDEWWASDDNTDYADQAYILRYTHEYAAPTDDWSDEDKQTFYYLYTQDKEKAFEFGLEINNDINRAAREQQETELAAWQNQNGLTQAAGWAYGTFVPLATGLYDYSKLAAEQNERGTITEKATMDSTQKATQMMETVAQDLNSKSGTIDESVPIIGGKGLGDLAQIASSMAQSAAIGYATGGSAFLTNAAFFGMSATQGIYDAKERGLDDEHAVLLGTLNGLAEAAGETFSVENLLKNIKLGRTGFANLLKSTFMQGGVEASEEMMTTIMNTFADWVVNGDQSELTQNLYAYMNEGMSYDEASKKATTEWLEGIVQDGLGGFLSGGGNVAIMGGVGNVVDSATTYKGNASNLIYDANMTAEGSRSRQYAQKVENSRRYRKSGNISNRQAAALDERLRNDLNPGDQATIQNAVENRLKGFGSAETGLSDEQAKSFASTIADAVVNGKELPASVRRNGYAQSVYNDLVSGNKDWVFNIGTKRFGGSEYGAKSVVNATLSAGNVYGKHTVMSNDLKNETVRLNGKDMTFAGFAYEDGKLVPKATDADGNTVTDAGISLSPKLQSVQSDLQGLADMAGRGAAGVYSLLSEGQDVTNTVEALKIAVNDFAAEGSAREALDKTPLLSDLTESQKAWAYSVGHEMWLTKSSGEITYETLTNYMTKSAAESLTKMFNDEGSNLSPDHYAAAVVEAYNYGLSGQSLEQLDKANGISKELTDAQREKAFQLGQKASEAKTASADIARESRTRKVRGSVDKRGINEHKLNDRQRSAVKMAEIMSAAYNINFHFYSSYKNAEGQTVYSDRNGEHTAPNGWYQNGEIWLDVNAGDEMQGIVLHTMAHELTHFSEDFAPKEFAAFRDALVNAYNTDNHTNYTVNQLVRMQQNKASRNGRSISYSEAMSEFVADSCESFLDSGKFADVIAEVSQANETLAERIKSFLKNVLEKLHNLLTSYQNVDPESAEGRVVKAMAAEYDKLQDMYINMVQTAGANYSGLRVSDAYMSVPSAEVANSISGADIDGDEGSHIFSTRSMVEGAGFIFETDENGHFKNIVDRNGHVVKKVTAEHIKNSPIGDMIKLATQNPADLVSEDRKEEFKNRKPAITEETAEKEYEMFASVYNLIIAGAEPTLVWDMVGTNLFSAIKNNSDPQYRKTIDMSTVCKKTQAIVDAMSKAMVDMGRGLTREEVIDLYIEVNNAGEPVPCPVCYVFSRWMGTGGILDDVKNFERVYGSMSEQELVRFTNSVRNDVVSYWESQGKKVAKPGRKKSSGDDMSFGEALSKMTAKRQSNTAKELDKIGANINARLENKEYAALIEEAQSQKSKIETRMAEIKSELTSFGKGKLLAEQAERKDALKAEQADLRKQRANLNRQIRKTRGLIAKREQSYLTDEQAKGIRENALAEAAYNDKLDAYKYIMVAMLEEDMNGNLKFRDDYVQSKKKNGSLPDSLLFDLNKRSELADKYPSIYGYLTSRGPGAGKAILPYSDARVGETVQGVAASTVKDIKIGLENMFIPGGDEEAKAKQKKATVAKALVETRRQNLIGGMRYQSTSDFRYEYGSDYLITFLEMQALGSNVQLYTKVIEAVDFFASMGADINLSLMPLGDGIRINADGSKSLVFSDVTGINYEAAYKKTKEYDNVQMILVGISDEHIRLAIGGNEIDFVIPYHASGNTVHMIRRMMQGIGESLDDARDYSKAQEDHFKPEKERTAAQKAAWDLRMGIIMGEVAHNRNNLTDQQKQTLASNGYLDDLYRRFYEDSSANEYMNFLGKSQAEKIFPYEYWDKTLKYSEADKNGERFVEYCESMGIVPRFSGVDSKGNRLTYKDENGEIHEYGNFAYGGENGKPVHGYWKLLIDRRMYDRQGNYREQRTINVSDFSVKDVDAKLAKDTYGDAMSKLNDPSKTAGIVETFIANNAEREKRAAAQRAAEAASVGASVFSQRNNAEVSSEGALTETANQEVIDRFNEIARRRKDDTVESAKTRREVATDLRNEYNEIQNFWQNTEAARPANSSPAERDVNRLTKEIAEESDTKMPRKQIASKIQNIAETWMHSGNTVEDFNRSYDAAYNLAGEILGYESGSTNVSEIERVSIANIIQNGIAEMVTGLKSQMSQQQVLEYAMHTAADYWGENHQMLYETGVIPLAGSKVVEHSQKDQAMFKRNLDVLHQQILWLDGQIKKDPQLSQLARDKQTLERMERMIVSHAAEMATLKEKHAAQMSKLRAEKNAKIDEVHAHDMEVMRERIKAEKAAKWSKVAETQEYYRERIDNIHDTQKRKDVRGKLKKLYGTIVKEINHPTETHHIPKEFLGVMQSALELINTDTRDVSQTLANIDAQIDKTTDKAKLAELYAKREKWLKKDEAFKAKVTELQDKYNSFKDTEKNGMLYDKNIADMIVEMSETIGQTALSQMSLEQLNSVYTTLQALYTTCRNAVKVTLRGKEVNAYEMMHDMRAETMDVGKAQTSLVHRFMQSQMRPDTFFRMLGGFKKNSVWQQAFDILNEGQLQETQYLAEMTQTFSELLTDDKSLRRMMSYKEADMVDLGLTDREGRKVLVSHEIMLAIYMHLLNEQNASHVMYGGMSIPDMKDYYKQSNDMGYGSSVHRVDGISERLSALRYQLRHAEDQAMRDTIQAQIDDLVLDAQTNLENLKSTIEAIMDNPNNTIGAYERKWVQQMQYLFDTQSKNILNETTLRVYGFEKATVDGHYFPIETDKSFLSASFESITKDMNLENAGFMKERVNSKKPLMIRGVTDVVSSQIAKTAKYAGLMPAIKDFEKIWGKSEAGAQRSLQQAVNDKFGKGGQKYIEHLLADLTGSRRSEDGTLGKIFTRVRGYMAASTLTLNPRVALAQAASFPTAASEVGWGPLMKALAHGGKNDTVISRADAELIAKFSPLLWYRMKGYAGVELDTARSDQTIRSRAQHKGRMLFGWIQGIDGATVGRLWDAAKYYIDEQQPNLAKGSDEYYREVAKVFNRIVERTQPNYTTMQRADLLRDPNALVKQLTMFMTQRNQNFNIIYESVGTLLKYRSDLANGRNDVTQADVDEAKNNVGRAVASQMVASVMIVGLKFLMDVILHSMNSYRDDDKDLTPESISWTLLDNLFDTIISNMAGGSEVHSIMVSIFSGSTYYGISLNGVDAITDSISDFVSLMQSAVITRDATLTQLNKLAKDVCVFMGIPLTNAEKIVNAFRYHIIDAINGEFLSMEAGVSRNIAQNASLLYEAYLNGDTDRIARIESEYDDTKNLYSKLKSVIQEAYLTDKKISKEQAVTQLMNFNGMTQNDAEKLVNKWTCEMATGVAFDDIKDEYLSGNITIDRVIEMYEKYGGYSTDDATAKAKQFQCEKDTGTAYSDIKDLVVSGEMSTADAINMIVKYGGKDKDAATKTVNGYACERDYGVPYSELDDAYKAGTISEYELKNAYQTYGGYTAEEAQTKADYAVYQKSHPDSDVSQDQYNSYASKTDVVDAGISADTYFDIKTAADETYGNSNGSITQAEAAEALKAQVNAGTITVEQANIIFASFNKSWKKTFSSYTGIQ